MIKLYMYLHSFNNIVDNNSNQTFVISVKRSNENELRAPRKQLKPCSTSLD